jgi:antitoxin (DNA-binding transcriptional repressor) of toxin-antitoxin stability system
MYTSSVKDVSITKRRRLVARISPVSPTRRDERVTLPLLKGKGRPGARCPNADTPYDLIFD